jgi:hypothetical protein
VQPLKLAAEVQDVDLMAAAFRAIYEFNDYVHKAAPEFRDRLNALGILLNEKSLTLGKRLRSAIAGALGSLNRGRGTASEGVIDVLLCLASQSMVLWQREASVHHEALWALNEIFDGRTTDQWGDQIRQLATRVAGNWQQVHMCFVSHVFFVFLFSVFFPVFDCFNVHVIFVFLLLFQCLFQVLILFNVFFGVFCHGCPFSISRSAQRSWIRQQKVNRK